MRNLQNITGQLGAMGLSSLLQLLLTGPVCGKLEYNFGSLPLAKRVQALLYDWLFFYPDIKAKVSLRVNPDTAALYIMSKAKAERRGRRKL